ncbi:hypothetical protein IPG36_02190 [bacterium]|nr:MAG: hypothetical protein IPG36_02190 [bacterium]
MTITHPINTIVDRLRDAGCIYTGYHLYSSLAGTLAAISISIRLLVTAN